MKHNNLFVLACSALLLASCGGGASNGPSYKKAEGDHTFPTYTTFSEADKAALPALGEHEIVAFCPVSTGFDTVYNWTRDTGGDHVFASWPGTAMTEKFNAKWWKVSYTDVDDLFIIFNKKGADQTRDMEMTHSGYWWYHESDGDIHDDIPLEDFIDSAKFVDGKSIEIVANHNASDFKLYEGEEVVVGGNVDYNAISVNLGDHKVDISKSYKVEMTINGNKLTKDVAMYKLYGSEEFDAQYAYDGKDLGVTYSKEKSTFKVWSPVSSEINLKIYESGTPKVYGGNDVAEQTLPMVKGDKGVFSVTVEGDLHGKYYTYEVTNNVYKKKEIVDPYARSAGINGLRGMILDMEKTNPEGWDKVSVNQIDRKAMVVYESHISDLTSSSTWNGTSANAKRYAGFHEAGTTYTEDEVTVKTGFDHIKELGVNAVQILPMYDQANDERTMTFNWGYNPLNYNVPEGMYSSDPYDGLVRVKEMKEMIADYTKAGINIIMDVVYNHVAGAVESNFDVLFPGYYYRYQESGALSNGSGCGNETASDHYMFRKFMIDSTEYWAKEYKLGGFRFDLMGLHDYETMNLLAANAKKVNPGIVIYGEPWNGGKTVLPDEDSAKQINGNKYEGYGQFNDGLRDGLIKGGMNAASSLGWATALTMASNPKGDVNAIKAGIIGTTLSAGTIADPDKTVNYVACHDNYTLHDRIAVNEENTLSYEDIVQRALLAQSVVMTSQGTSFMLSGDEILRSKVKEDGTYDHNSYESSYKTNEIDWALKVKNARSFEVYKKLIAFKKNVDGLHLGKEDAAKIEVEVLGSKSNLITYEIKDTANNKTYKIAHQAPFNAKRAKDLPCGVALSDAPEVDFSGYSEIYLNTSQEEVELSAKTKLGFAQTIIAVK